MASLSNPVYLSARNRIGVTATAVNAKRDLVERNIIGARLILGYGNRERLFAHVADGSEVGDYVHSDYLPSRTFDTLMAMALSERIPDGHDLACWAIDQT